MISEVQEQELKEIAKQSLNKTQAGLVISTATILIGLFWGGMTIVDRIEDSVIKSVDIKLSDFEKKQLIRDHAQDSEIIEIKNIVKNLDNIKK